MTTFIAGPAEAVSPQQMNDMLSRAQEMLSTVEPINVTLGRVIYHPEAVMLRVQPDYAVKPLVRAAQQATLEATGRKVPTDSEHTSGTPHVTVAYSTTQQAAEPLVSALGKSVPECTVGINELSLVVQWGPERLWDWEVIGTAELGTACAP
ncbi:2'-5' RNA ligase [Actinomadura rupiterrae]|nr:2'-5' RNA ligase [Actinomadura rupiterrae]